MSPVLNQLLISVFIFTDFTACPTTTPTTPTPTPTTSLHTNTTPDSTTSTNSTTATFVTGVTSASTFNTATTPPTTEIITTAPSVSNATLTTHSISNTTLTTHSVSTTTMATPNIFTTTKAASSVSTTTTTPSVSTTTTTPSVSTTTMDTTTISTSTTSKPTTAAPTTPKVQEILMSVTLNKTFKEEYTDKDSPEYKDLEKDINDTLWQQYQGIKGFHSVSVRGFRQGSVIVDFTVRTTQVIPAQIVEANKKLEETIKPVATVLSPVVAHYYSPTFMMLSPKTIYTAEPIKLNCGPPEIDVGTNPSFLWKFKGVEITKETRRFQVFSSEKQSTLTVSNVNLADAGFYECILRGDILFHQNKMIEEIKAAPNIQAPGEIFVQCQVGGITSLNCCVQSLYNVQWFDGSVTLESVTVPVQGQNCIKHDYTMTSCNKKIFTCKVEESIYEHKTTLTFFQGAPLCNDDVYGEGRANDRASVTCDKGQQGYKTAVCLEKTGKWKKDEDTCILLEINELLSQSADLNTGNVQEFTRNLTRVVKKKQEVIPDSSATISAIVVILNTIANVSEVVSEDFMQDILETIDVIIGEDTKESWDFLNAYKTLKSSSELLGSLETLSDKQNGTFTIRTQNIRFRTTTFSNSFNEELNDNVSIKIPDTGFNSIFITTITLFTLNYVMPTRDSSFNFSHVNTTDTGNAINAAVLLVKVNETIHNVSLSYNKLNTSLSLKPQCVFWNFFLFDDRGAWDDEGCQFVSDINDTVTCSCNHLTSFSILMATDIPESSKFVLDVITYVGVGISLASLVICLIIEGYVWREVTKNSTAFMRHVCIVNTALSLLIADICFIIGASITKQSFDKPNYLVAIGPCSAATFFMHFFYLGMFFWMLVSGLLLFYRTVMIFSHMSKWIMLAIGFILGYGCPLIIAVITVAVTSPGKGYIRKDKTCWLNWFETKALLALVIPALTIVVINILIILVVLYKMLRRNTAHTEERHALLVIIRCVAILTPLFGLTWSLGVGTMVSPKDEGIHIAFAFFNSLQGFFILVFGTLFDSKICARLAGRGRTISSGSNPTGSTSGGTSSLSGLNFINRLLKRQNYSRGANSRSNSSGSES
ncbi:adhesion G protein-coupled receptor F5 [Kryptolebias marmoratus]|uniref:adhesion G protein-coupled receptor F5 n=1 Tax=Kryptolebias marmoratus TaxID=37003 RepID=UPI0018ACE686|nr:adhesion G protein-coupled receptor F5 [Kryptolebias marmoratus]